MKVLVCGGRDFRSPAQVWHSLNNLHDELHFTEFMQGGARGVDEFAKEWAVTRPEIKRYVCKPRWDIYGKAAGPKRNARMLEWEPDFIVAFPGGRGTADMVRQAIEAGYKLFRRETTCHVYTKNCLQSTN